jgi:SAM-dependent methyltransferase
MDQCNPGFNDAIEKYFGSRRILPSLAGRAIELLERGRVWALGGQVMLNERIVEYPMVFRLIRPSGRVLDVGCASSRLPLELASLGYEVHGVDLRDFPISHASFTFHKCDLLQGSLPFEPESFDIVTAVSSIEHFGLGAYGDRPDDRDADRRGISVLRSLLKPGGQLILTCPFGRRATTKKHRIYDPQGLHDLLQGFTIQGEYYFRRRSGGWSPASKEALATVDSPTLPVNGVAIVDCVKPC